MNLLYSSTYYYITNSISVFLLYLTYIQKSIFSSLASCIPQFQKKNQYKSKTCIHCHFSENTPHTLQSFEKLLYYI